MIRATSRKNDGIEAAPVARCPHRRSRGISIAGTVVCCVLLAPVVLGQTPLPKRPITEPVYDVVVYGGTSAGVVAAVQVARMDGAVIILEPAQRLGGLTTGGLGQTDIGNKAAIGGISREFYQRVKRYYQDDENWRWQKRQEYRSGGQSRTAATEDAMWTFEPSAALKIMNELVTEHRIPIVYRARLDRSRPTAGVVLRNRRLEALRLEDGREIRGRVFVDATYEGDLLAAAGVQSVVGRESNAQYGESLNGVQPLRATHHQFVKGVDPYVRQGDPTSGVLPGIDLAGPGAEGAADHRVQAYCFRMCMTDHPDNRIPFAKPAGYDERQYELLFRNFEAGATVIPLSIGHMPNRKTDTNNNRGFSTDFIGQNSDYPEASYSERQAIVERHRGYQQGLMWSLAHHPRVPERVRAVVSRWGTCRDEFEREDGWQQQLYIREARRMVGQTVMTQHHCEGREVASRPIGLAAYTMDSHHVQRHLGTDGFARNEGDVQVGGFSPYPIDLGSILPHEDECENLVVPVCLSASHIAFGSIRMEPVFMVLGQSGATVAMHAIRAGKPVQRIDYDALRKQLIADEQRLVWSGPKRVPVVGIPAGRLKGIVVDDVDAERTGFGTVSQAVGPYVARGYRHDGNTAKGSQRLTFSIPVDQPGRYEVWLAYSSHENRASNVPVTVAHAEGETRRVIDQRKKPTDGPFVSLGVFRVTDRVSVTVSNAGTDGFVIADAIQLLPSH